ncbi:AMP-binding protein [Aeromicrobium terrae]|uniref:AMP-binding protein n=1 Tax=Aeromicrobium terrae TaxID=2498846 RepID=A0A5C8NET9_9ACTN|nr:AMP-binding protein [Aeromicrobium terrae]TXL57962.1 AMP-binding protein [Aeromicrobium terrae]
MTASLAPVSGEPRALLDLLRPWVRDGGDPLVIRTSGSTGEPKDVVLSHRAVLASATATHERLGGDGQWLLALPADGVAGLQVLVRSALAGTDPVVASEHDDLEAALAALDRPRRYASLVPTQLHRLDAADRLDVLTGLDALLIGGAAIDPGLLERARTAGVTVVRTYGMSETCGGCVYDGVPLRDVRMRIGDDGQVLLAGPVLFDGYAGRPFDGEWFATSDLGEIDDDGRLHVLGRMDDVVVSGGVNVPLPAVERVLRAVDAVGDAAVVGVDDEEWGAKVVAVVVPADAVCLDGCRLDELRDAVTEAGLPRTWAPRDVVLADALPLLPGGKVDRLALRRLAAR